MVTVETIAVEVACAEPDRQTVLALEVEQGCTAGDALERSGIFALHPGIDRGRCAIGIFGREVVRDTRLRAGDRVEVLRPLTHDPRERRRQLARQRGAGRSRSADGG